MTSMNRPIVRKALTALLVLAVSWRYWTVSRTSAIGGRKVILDDGSGGVMAFWKSVKENLEEQSRDLADLRTSVITFAAHPAIAAAVTADANRNARAATGLVYDARMALHLIADWRPVPVRSSPE